MKKSNFYKMLLVFCMLSPLPSFAEQKNDALSVYVKGAKPGTGQVIASLFSSPENYMKAPISKRHRPVDEAGQVRFVFDGLKAGTYAVSIVYDEDEDGKLNTGFLGIPSELVGFSNNAKGRFGPPSFDKAAFNYPNLDTIVITLGRAKE